MAPLHIEKHPRPEVLRWFGVSVAAFFALIGVMAWFRFDAFRVAWVAWCAGVAWGVGFYAVPRAQRAMYLAWMFATAPLGWLLLNVVLLTLYYGMLLPLSLVLRAFGHDPMARKASSRGQTSFWVKHDADKPLERYFAQY